MILYETTRKELIDKSKKAGSLSRYKSRTQIDKLKVTRVGVSRPSKNSVNLDLYFEVQGVTDRYTVSLRLVDFFHKFREEYHAPDQQNSPRRRGRPSRPSEQLKIIKSVVDNSLKTGEVQVNCSCPDFRYRFAYVSTIKDYGFDVNETRPAPVRNPNDKEGVCKHIMKILTRPSSWAPKAIKMIYDLVTKDSSILGSSEDYDHEESENVDQ